MGEFTSEALLEAVGSWSAGATIDISDHLILLLLIGKPRCQIRELMRDGSGTEPREPDSQTHEP